MHRFILVFVGFIMGHWAVAQSCYWQQEAHYRMKITMDVETNQYEGAQKLRYTNNSPDALTRLYYHLYFNAFQPGSMMDMRNLTLPDSDSRVGDRISHLKPDEIGFQKIRSVQIAGRPQSFTEDGTILIVRLDHPIQSGETVEIDMLWEAQVPLQIRRSGRDNREGIRYSMSQWYPKLCAYDVDGWHPNPYVGREFYGNWGSYDVTIDIDKKYTVVGTGYLDDPSLWPSATEPRALTEGSGIQRWHFKTDEPVHDFTWAADPDFVHRYQKGDDGFTMHYFYQIEEETEEWKKLPALMDAAVNFMEEHFGEYPYQDYYVVQGGDGGMEYPMLTLITGHRSLNGLVGVTIHELFHSWYQGVLATDEAQYAWMDEGFTSYASDRTMNYLACEGLLEGIRCQDFVFAQSYAAMMQHIASGRLNEPLSIHADHYETNGAYGSAAYVKGKVFLHQLEYILGQEVFDRVMLRYYDEWGFKHPTAKDFIRVAEEETGMILDWYHDYWVNDEAYPDIRIDSVYSDRGVDVIILSRPYGTMPMPVDLELSYENGDTDYYTIPLRMMRSAKEQDGPVAYHVSDDWPWTHPHYELRVPARKEALSVVTIDPSLRLFNIGFKNSTWPHVYSDDTEDK